MLGLKQKIPSAKWFDLVSLASRIFKVRPYRTTLTILGIGVSFATIFFLLSLGYGLQNILLAQISDEQALRTIDVTTPSPSALPITDRVLAEMNNIPGVETVQPIVATIGQAEIGDIVTETIVQSAPDEIFQSIAPPIVEGRLLRANQSEALLSKTLAQLLSVENSELIGSTIKVTSYVSGMEEGVETVNLIEHPEIYKIVGVTNSEQNLLFVSFDKIQGLGLPYGLVKVVVKSDKQLNEVRGAITNFGFTTSVLADTVEQANQIFRVFQFILALFGIAALVVAIIGMVNTMTISLLERIHEIGIMKIFGITEADIKILFFLEASIVGFLGGLSGLLLGYGMSRIFNFIIGFLARSLGGKPVELFFYPTWFVIAILVFSSLVGFIIGYSPAKKASKQDPLKALNFK